VEDAVDDIAGRYAPMIEQMAEIYAAHEAAHVQLRSLKVTREEWDDNMRGGHFWFDVSGPPGIDDYFMLDARAFDGRRCRSARIPGSPAMKVSATHVAQQANTVEPGLALVAQLDRAPLS
jgi:hypothetical protein